MGAASTPEASGAERGLPRWARPLYGLVVFLAGLAYLGPGVQRAVGGGDSAEFVVACATLGVPHPTGYPLYVWLGKAFTLVPVGGVAARVNFMSAVFAALALVVLADVVLRELRDRGAGRLAFAASFAAAALLATTLRFQEVALVAEVYTFKCFFTLLLIHVLIGYVKEATKTRLYVLALVYGVALGVHMSHLFLLPWILLFVWRRVFGSLGVFLRCVGLVALGLTQYVGMYFQAMLRPAYLHQQARFFERMPETGTDASLVNWAWFVTGGRWRGGKAWSLSDFGDKSVRIAEVLAEEYGLVLLALGLAGLVLFLARAGARRRTAVLLAFFAAELGYFAAFRPVVAFMVLPVFACVCAFVGLGLGALPPAVAARVGNGRAALVAGVAAVVLAVPVLLRLASKPRLDYSQRDYEARFVERMIAEVPPGSRIAGLSWHFNRVALYYELVEGRELPFDYRLGVRPRRIVPGRTFVLGGEEEYADSEYRLEPFLRAGRGGATLYRIETR